MDANIETLLLTLSIKLTLREELEIFHFVFNIYDSKLHEWVIREIKFNLMLNHWANLYEIILPDKVGFKFKRSKRIQICIFCKVVVSKIFQKRNVIVL